MDRSLQGKVAIVTGGAPGFGRAYVQAELLVERTMRELGRVDVIVNNVGGLLTPIEGSHAPAIPEDDIRRWMPTS